MLLTAVARERNHHRMVGYLYAVIIAMKLEIFCIILFQEYFKDPRFKFI